MEGEEIGDKGGEEDEAPFVWGCTDEAAGGEELEAAVLTSAGACEALDGMS